MDGILEIKPARHEYWDFIRVLRTHPKLKDGFIDQSEITPSDQVKYMKRYHKSYWVGVIEGEPVGFVGIVNNDIRVAVSPEHQNKGIGKSLVSYLSKQHKDAVARVKMDNTNSLQLFQSLKFKIRGMEKKAGETLYLLSR